MTTQIRHVGLVLVGAFFLLFANLHLVQLVRAADFSEDARNPRLRQATYAIERGALLAGGTEIARTVASPEGPFQFVREYPEGPLYAHATGWSSFSFGRQGLEDVLDTELNGGTAAALAEDLRSLLDDRPQRGHTVTLTLDPGTQAEARRALGDRTGAVVVLEARTGRVVALYSQPTYDPNAVADQDFSAAKSAHDALQQDPSKPLLDRTRRALFPPGSTFKILVAAAALESGIERDTAFADRPSYTPPLTTSAITNFSPGPCRSSGTITLEEALVVSCNTVFAELGVTLGADTLAKTLENFGFEADLPFELSTARSTFGDPADEPSTAQAAIGQRDVRVTALHQAVIQSAIVNQGVLLRPYLVEEILDESGRTVSGSDQGRWTPTRARAAVSPATAGILRDMLIGVVERGTGRRAAITDVIVGGKTGTAQVPGETSTVWFVGFAERGAESYAVAVVLPDAGEDATGGGTAAPIAQAVLEAALKIR